MWISLFSQAARDKTRRNSSSCAKGGLDQILGKISSLKLWLIIGTAQRCSGVSIPGSLQETTGYDPQCYDLVDISVWSKVELDDL